MCTFMSYNTSFDVTSFDNTSFDNSSIKIIHNVFTTLESLKNHTNHTNHTNETNHDMPIGIVVLLVIIFLMLCVVSPKTVNKFVSHDSEPCFNKLIKFPFY